MSTWTTEKPTKPGWYWFRMGPGNYPIIEHYDMSAGGLVMWANGMVFPIVKGEWQGPLEPEE